MATSRVGGRETGMTNRIDDAESVDIRDALRLVDARLDAGDEFEARCRSSLAFSRAVEDARMLRAYAPGVLRRRAIARVGSCASGLR